jgi:hypothetical protein
LETQRTVNPLAPPAILGGCLLLGLVMGGWVVLGSEIKEIKLADRCVTVKGLVERTVRFDIPIWPVSFKDAGNDLPQEFAKSQMDKDAVLKFFAAGSDAQGDFGWADQGDGQADQ